tara:strand:- start:487 stop:642 length:156 start_codon:yes stop_codon:yes gene_type:complete
VSLFVYFLAAFILGFVTVWLSTPPSKDTFIIFESGEELDEMCWGGLRRGQP